LGELSILSEHSIRTVVVFLFLSIIAERKETEQKFESEQNFIFCTFLGEIIREVKQNTKILYCS